MVAKWRVLPVAALLSLSACAMAPTAMVLPGVGKPFEEFQRDDGLCLQWAAEQAEGAEARASRTSGRSVRDRYDIAYQQCMYARGNQIPGAVPASPPGRVPPPPPGTPSGR